MPWVWKSDMDPLASPKKSRVSGIGWLQRSWLWCSALHGWATNTYTQWCRDWRLPKGGLASYCEGKQTSPVKFSKPLRGCQLMAVADRRRMWWQRRRCNQWTQQTVVLFKIPLTEVALMRETSPAEAERPQDAHIEDPRGKSPNDLANPSNGFLFVCLAWKTVFLGQQCCNLEWNLGWLSTA